MSKRKRKKNKGSSSITTKRRNFQFNKENKVPEDRNEVESDEGSQEKQVTNMDRTEVESSQDCPTEDNENILQERQKNGNENKPGTENERGRVTLVAKSASGKKSVMLPERSDLRKESDTMDCQMPESSEDGDSNDSWAYSMSDARRSRIGEQQGVCVEEVVEILPLPEIVDFYELKQLLHFVTEMTEDFNVFQLEKLYAILSQCIYQHREDYNKTELVQEMKRETAAFTYVL